jgi:hypothetical protein
MNEIGTLTASLDTHAIIAQLFREWITALFTFYDGVNEKQHQSRRDDRAIAPPPAPTRHVLTKLHGDGFVIFGYFRRTRLLPERARFSSEFTRESTTFVPSILIVAGKCKVSAGINETAIRTGEINKSEEIVKKVFNHYLREVGNFKSNFSSSFGVFVFSKFIWKFE